MHTHRKILSLLLLAAIVVFGCKKSKKTVFDNIAGTYVGEHKFSESHTGGLSNYNHHTDTTIDADMFIIKRLSSDSFSISTITSYSFLGGGWRFRGNNENLYTVNYMPYWLELKIVAEKDSVYYEYINRWNSGASGFYGGKETFSGKKIK